MSLTVAILNHLPAKLLQPTLKSVSFADEIIIIHDLNSKYPPPNFKRKIRVFLRALNQDFSAQRNFALKKAKNPWVLFVDSDEIVSKKLAREIKLAIQTSDYQGYLLSRQDVVLGKALKHGETGSIKLLRLAKKETGKFSRSVHETWLIRGRVGELKTPLIHLKKDLTSSFVKKIIRYGLLDSQELVNENKPFSLFRLLVFPMAKFVHNYIVRLGILDGSLGLFHAYLMSVQSLSVRVFQWQDNHS